MEKWEKHHFFLVLWKMHPPLLTDKKRSEIHISHYRGEIIYKSQSFTNANQFHIHSSQIGVPPFIIAPLYHVLLV